MAETTETEPISKPEILQQLASSRIQLQLGANRLRQDLSVPAKLKQSVARSPGSWLSAAAFGGLVLSLLPRGAKKPSRKMRKRQLAEHAGQPDAVNIAKAAGLGGTLVTLVKLLLPLFKPAITTYATSRMASYVKNR